MRILRTIGLAVVVFMAMMAAGCDNGRYDPDSGDDGSKKTFPNLKEGAEYVFDDSVIPEVHISVSLSEWNRLLKAYDNNKDTKEYIMCDVRYVKGGETTTVNGAGLRLRGNTSRRRPEGNGGESHSAGKTDWHHVHFGINFREYAKDEAHTLHGQHKIILKWFKDDPSYSREIYCYDLFHRYGIWTAAHDVYCRLWLKIEGDSEETYYGVYGLVEPVTDEFIKVRNEKFASSDGFLWRCRNGAGLNSTSASMGPDDGSGKEYVYELKTGIESFDKAKAQLVDFISNLNKLENMSFHEWIASHCDTELLLKTYAVNVVVGMWDDYWNNANNWYIYFDSQDPSNYKAYFIPYDYDNTLGTSINCGVQSDSGRQDPLKWGRDEFLWIRKMLESDDYRKVYIDALKELVSPSGNYAYYITSSSRIKFWQNSIREYVPNDTGEETTISDRPASWSSHQEYRITDTGPNSFFRVKAGVIDALQ